MNIILDAFERVFSPKNASNAKRRASSSGLVTTLTGPINSAYSSSSRRTTTTTMNTATSSSTATNALLTNCYQQLESSKQNQRHQSGGDGAAINVGFQNEFVALSIEEPSIQVSNEASSMRIQRQESCTSRSRSSNSGGGSRRQRKKSSGTSGNDKSMASLIFSALSSPNDSRMRRRKANNNNGNRMSGKRRQLPPRQWSVPEREGNSNVNITPERDNVVAEPFRLIQKAYSLCCEEPSSSSRSSLMGSPHSPLSISSHNCFNSGATILFGFVNSTASSINSSLNVCWEKVALESSRMLDSEAYFLRCIDPEPKLPFIYYASVAPDNEQHDINNLAEAILNEEEIDNSTNIQLGCYEELYTLERATDKNQSNKCSTHQGFILIFFRLLGDANGSSNDLESRWLNWTGAGQIYKYSPRCWELQKVCLLRHLQHSSPRNISSTPSTPTSFAYILLCEFNEILHPSNALAALNLCEKLRIRNCGLVALYKVSQSCVNTCQQQKQQYRQQSLLFDQKPPKKETNLSPNWPLSQQYRKHQLGRMGRSHDERISIGARQEKNSQSPPSPRPSCGSKRENSQLNLNDSGGGTEKLRRLIWSREQQHSLGWEQQRQQPPPQQWLGQLKKNGTLL